MERFPYAYSSAEPAISGTDAGRSQSRSRQSAHTSRDASARACRRASDDTGRYPASRRTCGSATDHTAGDPGHADNSAPHCVIHMAMRDKASIFNEA